MNKLILKAKSHFPNLKIKYKDESLFMKIIGKLLFFNKSFMDNFVTTIGDTVYFTNRQKVEHNPISSSLTLLHELVHVYDSHKDGRVLFSFLYLFPQILAPLALLLCFFSWKFIPLFLLLLLPLPAYFRMKYEKRAYMVSLYAQHHIYKKLGVEPSLEKTKNRILSHFKDSSYYFMWVFDWKLEKGFSDAVIAIKSGKRPYEDEVFDVIDDLIKQY